MVQLKYPRVYIQELPSGVRTIVGVATSIAAFVDSFPSGPMNEALRGFSFPDFECAFERGHGARGSVQRPERTVATQRLHRGA